MPFEFLEPTDMKLENVAFRAEKHGDDDVIGVSCKLSYTGPNTLLDGPFPGLRKAIYMAVEGQGALPGVEESTPKLRTKLVALLNLNSKFEGWTVAIEHGVNDAIVMGKVKIDKVTVLPMEGGTVQLGFRIGTNDIDAEESGLLVSKMKQTVAVTIKAPEKPTEAIDGTVGHPGVAKQKAEDAGQGALALDDDEGSDDAGATGAFVAAHSDGQADSDDDGDGEEQPAAAADGAHVADAQYREVGEAQPPAEEPAAAPAAEPPAGEGQPPAAKVARSRRKTTAQFIDAHTKVE